MTDRWKRLSYQEVKTYKHSPEVRAAMALLKREQRVRKKLKAAGMVCGPTPATSEPTAHSELGGSLNAKG